MDRVPHNRENRLVVGSNIRNSSHFVYCGSAYLGIDRTRGPWAIADWVWNNPPVELLIVSASALLVGLLVWWDRRGNGNYVVRLLSWIVGYELTVKASIGTAKVLNPILLASLAISVTFLVAMGWELATSQIEDMAQSQFNIAHVALLPFITLLAGLLVWFCLRPRSSALGQSTADELLALVFYVMLILSVAILLVLFFIHPVDFNPLRVPSAVDAFLSWTIGPRFYLPELLVRTLASTDCDFEHHWYCSRAHGAARPERLAHAHNQFGFDDA